jgi:hypothetical protein
MKRFKRFTSAMLALLLAVTLLPATPVFAYSTNDHYITYSSTQSSWTASTDMVNWSSDEWTTTWVNWLTKTGVRNPSFSQRVEATYDSVVSYADYNYALLNNRVEYNGQWVYIENIPTDDLAYYVPQYTFSELLDQVAQYVGGNANKPQWTCGDYSRFMVGLLRAQGIPAYMEVGYQSYAGRYHMRVAIADTANKRIYYSDPTFGATSGNSSKWTWLTWTEYTDDYSQAYMSSERLPSKRPADNPPSPNRPNPQPPIVRPNYPAKTAISIPAANRYDDVVVPIRKNGRLVANVPMRVVWYDNAWWFTARDACMVLDGTTKEVNVRWSSDKNTLLFERGSYQSNGTEVNWDYGSYISIDKKSQAYLLPPAFFCDEQTNIRVISIGGTTYVRPIDIAKMMNFDGSVSKETELGGSFDFR